MKWEEFLSMPATYQVEVGMQALRAEVEAAGPDFIYRPYCQYVRDGEPSCLIAKTAARLGAPIVLLEEWDEVCGLDAVENSKFSSVMEVHRYPISPILVQAWVAAQDAQDNRRTWGFALQEAERVVYPDASTQN